MNQQLSQLIELSPTLYDWLLRAGPYVACFTNIISIYPQYYERDPIIIPILQERSLRFVVV